MKHILSGFFACCLFISANTTQAQDHHQTHNHHAHHVHSTGEPLGVMGAHMHKKGEWMLSYRAMHMNMHGSRKGTDRIDPLTIATTEANRFFGIPGQPPTLRVVPTDMTMDMHMFGLMGAPTDWLTIMAMGMWQEKEMDHITFQGGAGATVLGTFTTRSKGWGDTKLSTLIRLHESSKHHIHMHAGISLPTGSIDETATVLAPNGSRPRLRMPYAMQLGTGTFDFLPGITYTGHSGAWSWGAQYTSEIRLEDENWEGYAWDDKHNFSLWGGYQWVPWIHSSLRLFGTTQGKIDGIDPNIVAPVQTADPDNFGGDILEAAVGLTLTPQKGYLRNHSFGTELSLPLYRDLNGPQLETDWSLVAAWKITF